MIEKNSVRVLGTALNLFAVSSPMLVSQTSYAAPSDQNMEKLNMASLKSIESTWLQIPNACKAREFHADPVSLENKKISKSIQNIYASFEN